MCCRADDYGVQVAREPALRSPGARLLPCGVTSITVNVLFSCGYTSMNEYVFLHPPVDMPPKRQ